MRWVEEVGALRSRDPSSWSHRSLSHARARPVFCVRRAAAGREEKFASRHLRSSVSFGRPIAVQVTCAPIIAAAGEHDKLVEVRFGADAAPGVVITSLRAGERDTPNSKSPS